MSLRLFSSQLCLSAIVPALCRSRHPFAVSGQEWPSPKTESVFSCRARFPEAVLWWRRRWYLPSAMGCSVTLSRVCTHPFLQGIRRTFALKTAWPEITPGKSAGVHECVRSDGYDFLRMSLDENRASHELAVSGQSRERGFSRGGQQIVSDLTYAESRIFLNPQTDPQNAMSYTTCVYLGNLHVLVSRCKT